MRKTNAVGMSEMACSTVHIESHDSCKCGCDVEAAQCSDLQVSPCSVNIKDKQTYISNLESKDCRVHPVCFIRDTAP